MMKQLSKTALLIASAMFCASVVAHSTIRTTATFNIFRALFMSFSRLVCLPDQPSLESRQLRGRKNDP